MRCFLLFFLFTNGVFAADIESLVRAHLLIGDHESALQTARLYVRQNPREEEGARAYLAAAANAGAEKEMVLAQRNLHALIGDSADSAEILEIMAWGCLTKASRSSSPIIRLYATVGAHFARDARGIMVLKRALADPHVLVRVTAVQLAGKERDDVLKKKMIKLLDDKKCWPAYLEAISSVGTMKMCEAKDRLSTILFHPGSSSEEKRRAAEALAELYEGIDREELAALCKSDRAELRKVAAQLILKRLQEEDISLIAPLLQDASPDVRQAAITVIGWGRFLGGGEMVTPLLDDPDPETAITAAWAALLFEKREAEMTMRRYLFDPRPEVRRQASLALANCGKYALPLIEEAFFSISDKYGRWNLALAQLKEKRNVEISGKLLHQAVQECSDLWERPVQPPFGGIAEAARNPAMIRQIKAQDQLVRLELLAQLAAAGYEGALQAVESFLEKTEWGVSGTAASVLLMEGSPAHLEVIEELLDHPKEQIRIQAAMVMAAWGSHEKAMKTLQKAYPTARRDAKERIIETMGSMSDEKALPFLRERLSEASQTLRVIAASSILQTLYN